MKAMPLPNRDGRLVLLPHPAQAAFLEAKRRRLSDGSRAFRRDAARLNRNRH
jgi:type IV secretory pathway protease TraF